MLRSSLVECRRTALLAMAAGLAVALPAAAAKEKPAPTKPKIEVVFCLDTTGSMGGLIEGAKQKIWSISNQIAGGKPTPELKIGLVAYRDRGDAYITKVIELTDDLDAIHGHLRGFQAQGGGDGPESVNQALDDAVNKIKWSADKKTLRIIFLVGDAPPHMDYADDVKFPVTCKKACEKGIIINSIQCGGDIFCQKYWKEICKLAEGSYVQIAQNGGVVVAIATPFDKRLTEINGELAKTTLVYGDRYEQMLGLTKNAAAEMLDAPAAAARAAYQCKNGWCATYDLLDNIKQGKIKLEELKKEQLPAELQKLEVKERKAYLDKLDKRRGELRKECLDLDKKRSSWIAKKQAEETAKGKSKDGFDSQVLEVLRNQAKKNGVDY
jgi:Mg-chelatase subunit ChlD